jgi:hypothetical protein
VSPIDDSPLYDELARRHHYDVPAHVDGNDPAMTMLPLIAPVDVPLRVDGWCEDRDPAELTDDDGVE